MITFRGQTLISDSEGAYHFQPGSRGRDKLPVKLARSTRLMVKDLGESGAEHRLTLIFAVTDANVSTIKTRIENACSMTPGALVVPGFPTINNCVIMGKPEWSEQKKITLGNAKTAGYLYYVNLLFLEL